MKKESTTLKSRDVTKFKYDAFISYRTSVIPDGPIGEELQKVLESYPVPTSLNQHLVEPRRFRNRLKVFRDTTDLSAGVNLNQAIMERLQGARWLVVVCSPNTPLSQYCIEEMRYFEKLHGVERMLFLLIAGEPSESIHKLILEAKTAVETTKAQKIAGIDFLAADVRARDVKDIISKLRGRGIPKQKQARFKILAPLLGCTSPDTLIQRHRARVRRLITQVSMVILAVATVVFWFFYNLSVVSKDQERVVAVQEWMQRDPTTAALILTELIRPELNPMATNLMHQLATQPLAQAIFGEEKKLSVAKFDPTGTIVLTESVDGNIHLWPIDGKGRPLEIEGSKPEFSPNGDRVVTISGSKAYVWPTDGYGDPIVLTHEAKVEFAFWSPSGKILGTVVNERETSYEPLGERDGWVRVWRADGQGDSILLSGHTNDIEDASFNDQGTHIVTASIDGTARVWRADGQGNPVVLKHDGDVKNAVFNSTSTFVLTMWSEMAGTDWARIWRADGSGYPVDFKTSDGGGRPFDGGGASFNAEGTLVLITPDVQNEHLKVEVRSIDGIGETANLGRLEYWSEFPKFSPTGRHVLIVSEGEARVIHASGRGGERPLTGHRSRILSASFNNQGTHIVTASLDGTARVWQTDGNGEPIILQHSKGVWDASFNKQGTHVLTVSEDRTARVWRLSGVSPVVHEVHGGWIAAATLDPSGTNLALAHSDGTITVRRSVGGGEELVLGYHANDVRSINFDSTGTRVVTASLDGTARVWSVNENEEPVVLDHEGEWVDNAIFNESGSAILTHTENENVARVWRVGSIDRSVLLGDDDDYAYSAVFDSAGRRVATLSFHQTARVWRADGDGAPIVLTATQNLKPAEYGISCCAVFNPSGSHIAIGGSDSNVYVWRADGGGTPLILKGHNGEVRDVAFSKNGDNIISASVDKSARIWCAGRAEKPVLLPHDEVVETAEFNSSGTLVLTTSDGKAMVWNVDGKGKPLVLRRNNYISSASFSKVGKEVLTIEGSATNGTASIWSIEPTELQQLLREATSACLTSKMRHLVLGESEKRATKRQEECELSQGRIPIFSSGK